MFGFSLLKKFRIWKEEIPNFVFPVQKFSQTIKTLRDIFPFVSFDTGVFLTSSQILKMCEKIQDAGKYLIIQDDGIY